MKKVKRFSIDTLITAFSVIMVLYHLLYTQTLILGPIEHQNMHILLAEILLILISWKKSGSIKNPTLRLFTRLLFICLLIAAIGSCSYVFVNFRALEHRIGMNTSSDIVIGVIFCVVMLVLCREHVGNVLPILAIVFALYTQFGHLLDGMLWHFKIPFSSAISKYSIGFSGIFGSSMSISADYIFLFMVFGSFLSVSGGTKFFVEIGKLIGRRSASGPGMTATISCALVGMVTGSGMANVSICGPFCVPMMRNVGYSDKQTSGILTTAATGALLVPPMMGVVAFVMADYIGIPYVRICMISVLPCLLYYLCIAVYVIIAARKNGIKKLEGDVQTSAKEIFGTCYLFFIPLAEIIFLLIRGYSLRMISFIICVTTFVLSYIRKDTRKSFKEWANACADGAISGAGIAVACGMIGIVLACFDITGLGLKFPSMIETIANGSLLIALLLVALITIILGCGIPPFASYMIVAMMCAPVLVSLGCTTLQAHYFIFLFTVFGQMTPPVAITAVAAAPLCNVSYLTAGVEAVKCGWLAWIMPFFIIWCPMLIFESTDYLYGFVALLGCLMLIIAWQAAFLGHLKTSMRFMERLLLLVSGFLFCIFEFAQGVASYVWFAAGAVLFLLIYIGQMSKAKKIRVQMSEA